VAVAVLVCQWLENEAGGTGDLSDGSFRRNGMERAKNPRNG